MLPYYYVVQFQSALKKVWVSNIYKFTGIRKIKKSYLNIFLPLQERQVGSTFFFLLYLKRQRLSRQLREESEAALDQEGKSQFFLTQQEKMEKNTLNFYKRGKLL